jgi:hypothetical protein
MIWTIFFFYIKYIPRECNWWRSFFLSHALPVERNALRVEGCRNTIVNFLLLLVSIISNLLVRFYQRNSCVLDSIWWLPSVNNISNVYFFFYNTWSSFNCWPIWQTIGKLLTKEEKKYLETFITQILKELYVNK